MTWSARATLTLAHEFYEGQMPPLDVRPTDPAAFARDGLMMRRAGAAVHILGQPGGPDRAAVTVLARDPAVFSVTQGLDRNKVPHFTLTEDETDLDLARRAADAHGASGANGVLGNRIARIDLPLSGGEIRLTWPAIRAVWTYHVIGAGDGDDIEIVDPAGAVRFEPAGRAKLPDGRPARLFRSDKSLGARLRAGQRFTLQRSGEFGPEPLIHPLPVAGADIIRSADPGAETSYKSDIYVTLW